MLMDLINAGGYVCMALILFGLAVAGIAEIVKALWKALH
jgi:hypothetical protein